MKKPPAHYKFKSLPIYLQTERFEDLKHASWMRVFHLIGKPNDERCWDLYRAHMNEIVPARGSKSKHQAWEGGYIDHVVETVGIAEKLYETMNDMRPLPFSLPDAALVLYIHDLEKPFKHLKEKGKIVDRKDLKDPKQRKQFVRKLLKKFKIKLTSEQDLAYQYIEGEGNDYDPHKRVQNPLGAFCAACDNFSARIWFDYPRFNNPK